MNVDVIAIHAYAMLKMLPAANFPCYAEVEWDFEPIPPI